MIPKRMAHLLTKLFGGNLNPTLTKRKRKLLVLRAITKEREWLMRPFSACSFPTLRKRTSVDLVRRRKTMTRSFDMDQRCSKSVSKAGSH